MVARVATFNKLDPAQLDQAAVLGLRKIVRETPGFIAGYHLSDPRSGKGLSIVIIESPDVGRAIAEALDARPADARVGIDPDEVEFFTAEPF
jgi:hypothetical protein